MSFAEEEIAYLYSNPLGRFATVDPDGARHPDLRLEPRGRARGRDLV
jgi:hypothetical protein